MNTLRKTQMCQRSKGRMARTGNPIQSRWNVRESDTVIVTVIAEGLLWEQR